MTPRTVDLTEQEAYASVPVQRGLSELAGVLRTRRAPAPPAPADALASLFEAELRLGLQEADAERAYEAAAALHRRTGDLDRCHRAVSRVLGGVGQAWADGSCSVAQEHRVTATAARVLARLRTGAPSSDGPRIVLAVPPGDRHLLALESLAHLLEQAGHRVDVVGELSASELADAAVGAHAVVLSAHVASPDLPALLATVRSAAPDVLLVVGGPAAGAASAADVVTQDVAVLLAALQRGACPLSDREREVLRCVADGLTNHEAASVLGVAPATLKTHLDHIFDKTGTSGRAAAVATGLRRGWIR